MTRDKTTMAMLIIFEEPNYLNLRPFNTKLPFAFPYGLKHNIFQRFQIRQETTNLGHVTILQTEEKLNNFV